MLQEYISLLSLRAAASGKPSDLVAPADLPLLDSLAAVLSSDFRHQIVSFAVSLSDQEYHSSLLAPTYHVAPILPFDIRVMSRGTERCICLTEGTLLFLQYCSRASLLQYLLYLCATRASVTEDSIFQNSLAFEPSTMGMKTKIALLEEVFAHPQCASISDYIMAKKQELQAGPDVAFVYCRTLLSCVDNSIRIQYLRDPFDPADILCGPSQLNAIAFEQVRYTAAFLIMHEVAHMINLPLEAPRELNGALDAMRLSEHAADSLAVRMALPAHRLGVMEAAREYFAIIQAAGERYPEAMARRDLLERYFRELSGATEEVHPPDPDSPLRQYIDRYGTGESLFGLNPPIDQQKELYRCLHQWGLELLRQHAPESMIHQHLLSG